MDANSVEKLFKEVQSNEGYQLTIDLNTQTVTTPGGEVFSFEIDAFRKNCLLNGLDDIGLTLQYVEDIKAYEARRAEQTPWL